MSSLVRRLPTSRLVALCAAVVAVLAGVVAIATAAGGSGTPPPAKPLAEAVHDAAVAPAPRGLTARVTFTNHLIDGASLPEGGDPVLQGAKGRLWIAPGGKVRLELQSDAGDAQAVSDGKRWALFHARSNTVYRGDLPAGRDGTEKDHAAPTLADVEKGLARLAAKVDVGGAQPSVVAGQGAYTVRLAPKHDGGLLGAVEGAWDAARGVPLRLAVYASGRTDPVLELKADDVTYGPVADSTFALPAPAGAKTVDVKTPKAEAGKRDAAGEKPDVTGVDAVSAKLPFALSAPDKLVGLPRHDVRLVDIGGKPGAVVTYGQGLGGIAVLEQAAGKDAASAAKPKGDGRNSLTLPKVSIDGATGDELPTALGTVLRFSRGGVSYVVAGSVPPAAAEAAARGL